MTSSPHYVVRNYRMIFPDAENRDALIEQQFPKRRCMATPGAFAVPGGYLFVNGLEVAYEIERHQKDEDCADHIDPADDSCFVCGVVHGDPCLDCGGRGFHNAGCPKMDAEDNRVFASQTF